MRSYNGEKEQVDLHGTYKFWRNVRYPSNEAFWKAFGCHCNPALALSYLRPPYLQWYWEAARGKRLWGLNVWIEFRYMWSRWAREGNYSCFFNLFHYYFSCCGGRRGNFRSPCLASHQITTKTQMKPKLVWQAF